MTIPVRGTNQPGLVLNVTESEFEDLRRQGLLYGSSRRLYVTFLSYSDGPLQDVEDVTIGITGPLPASTVVVATTSTGVVHESTGVYSYAWGTALTPAGSYVVTWTGVDVDDSLVTATETITVGGS